VEKWRGSFRGGLRRELSRTGGVLAGPANPGTITIKKSVGVIVIEDYDWRL
jgi:hypothetical protein